MDYFRPWVFLITDGNPTDFGWESAADEVQEEERRKGVSFYAVGVENADLTKLFRFSAQRQPVRLKLSAFQVLFQWLSKSWNRWHSPAPGRSGAPPGGRLGRRGYSLH